MSSPSLAELEYAIGAGIGRGDLSNAAAAAAACRRAWPHAPSGWLFGSIVALMANDRQTALAIIDEGLSRHPTDVQCLLQKAECLLALGRREELLAAAAAASSNAGRNVQALDAIGEFLVHAGEHGRALEVYDQAVRAAPGVPAMLVKRAAVHRFLGGFDLAATDYDAALLASPNDPEALKGLAELGRQTTDRNQVAAMEAALLRAPHASKDAATLRFGLAKSYEDLGEYPESWRHLSEGNRLERALFQYDPALDKAAVERLIAAFPSVETVGTDTAGESPIFIVGLPRTGTTLVERILGSHSAIHSAGELPTFSEAVAVVMDRLGSSRPADWLGYASMLGSVDAGLVAGEYLERARARRGTRPRFSDKQVINFFYCPLIFRAFPQARIVHLTRHPLAACYAIYKARFGANTYPFAYNLVELGDFYIGYRKLMAHWHRILPGRIFDLAYEDVVTAQEPTTRRLLDYVGLPFEEACLQFHLNPASTATSSAVQVRQPLYDSSLQQWRHYEAELAPLRKQLEAAGIPVD